MINIRMHGGKAGEGIIKITNVLHESGRACSVFIRLQTFVPFFALYLKIFSATVRERLCQENNVLLYSQL